MRDTPEQMAKIIMQVQAGALTATEAARQMKISRNTYYKRETKAFRAMVRRDNYISPVTTIIIPH